MEDMPPKYDPQGLEEKWNKYWENKKLFIADSAAPKPKYTITIPPPNVTGRLTLGHVLNNTVQDVLIRYKKMSGFETLWLPGMDHAGIATQVVVEERLLTRGIKKTDLGREKFIEEVWKWKEEYSNVIRRQLKQMGCALDWSRERFTLDENYVRAVMKVFVELYRRGLIYRGLKIINWCPRCQTTLSNEQVETENKPDRLYYLRYPLKDANEHLVIATTRPETMLGDTAVGINPRDPRYQEYAGKSVILPLMNREIPIINDEYVDIEFGTGCLKITPAHDAFDFELAKKHNLEIINIMNPDATINENGGPFQGLDRYAARQAVLEALRQTGQLEKTESYQVPLSTCERCHTVIEPRLSRQWFVRMKPLAEPALKAVRDGRIKIHPLRWINLYNHWLENVQDWPISRQLWWGHRLPIYYCQNCFDPESDSSRGIIVAAEKPDQCPACQGRDLRQDEDVLDTWFSSWLWPFATLGWPDRTTDLERFYPTQVLATGWDIIYLWVARMIMAGLEFTGTVPFHDVVFHTMIRDEKGRKMSKSLGNSPDPLDLIERYGADSVRFGILLITPREQDVLFSEKSLDVGRKFCNKLWNAARMIRLNFTAAVNQPPKCPGPFDQWLLHEFNLLLEQIEYHYQNFELNAIAKKIYNFVWHVFCDWYLELIKIEPDTADHTAVYMLRQLLFLLHPFMPFITEEIYQRLPETRDSILLESHPKRIPVSAPPEPVTAIIQLIEGIRNLRGLFNIKSRAPVDLMVDTDPECENFLRAHEAVLRKLGGISMVNFGSTPAGPAGTIIVPRIHAFISLPDIDINKEKARLNEEIRKLTTLISDINQRLNNPRYLEQVDQEVKKHEEEKLSLFLQKKNAIESAIERL